jgi:hypothetical protein
MHLLLHGAHSSAQLASNFTAVDLPRPHVLQVSELFR